MASINEEREAVKKIGQFPKQWAEKVNKMSDAQIHAIYIRLKSQGKL